MLVKNLRFELNYIESKYNENLGKQTFVVANENYVHVGEGMGLKGTEFNLSTPGMCSAATIFNSIEDANKNGMDYYLMDGAGERIILSVKPAAEYFDDMIKMINTLIKHLETNAE